MFKAVILILALVVSNSFANANDMEFTYNVNHQDSKVYGFDKKETYDIAIKIDDPLYVGTRVKRLKVDLPVQPGWVADCTGWISSRLKLENKKNAPDLASVKGVLTDEVLTVEFDASVTIPADGLYVGYSFTVKELGEYSTKPICLIEGDAPDGLWVHTSRSRMQWMNLGQELKAVSTMTVTLEGDFSTYDVAPLLSAECYAEAGKPAVQKCSFVNRGSVPVSSLSYEWAIGNNKGNGTASFEPAIACGSNNIGTAVIEMTVDDQFGSYPMNVKVTLVNGQPNGSEAASCASSMLVMPLIPVNRPLVEEFTGLNCAYCPRGYVIMEQMNEQYGDEFVAMAYHSVDYESAAAMCTVPTSDFPVEVSSYPNGSINRDKTMDPGYFPDNWSSYRERMPEAEVSAELKESANNKDAWTATATVTFVRDVADTDYKISIALVADGLFNPKWVQKNAFAGDSGQSGPLWEIFTKGPGAVPGLIFNDVVAFYKDINGISGMFPAEIHAGDVVNYSIDVNRSDIVNLSGGNFINDDARLKAIAILLDKTGKPVNCNKSKPIPYTLSGVENANADTQENTAYYDLTGREVKEPQSGIYIKRVTMADGTVKAHKVVF